MWGGKLAYARKGIHWHMSRQHAEMQAVSTELFKIYFNKHYTYRLALLPSCILVLATSKGLNAVTENTSLNTSVNLENVQESYSTECTIPAFQ